MVKFSTPFMPPLFSGIAAEDLDTLLDCLSAHDRLYAKGEIVLLAGDKPTTLGIIQSGSVQITKEDYFGNRNIIAEIGAGDMFGEALVCAAVEESPVTVTASEDSKILLLDYNKLITTCSAACPFHLALIKNMILVLVRKNRSLIDKLEHVTRRTTREKVLSYLSEQAKQHGSSAFTIPFSRQELADFLSVERSALSAELSKLRADHIIAFQKNHFHLL